MGAMFRSLLRCEGDYMFRDSVAVSVAVVLRTRPLAILLAVLTMRKSTRGFPFPSYMSMGLRLVVLNFNGYF